MYRLVFRVVVSLFAVSCLSAGSRGGGEKARMVVVPIQSANFVPVIARLPDGPQMAVLWGDPNAGPSAMLLEMTKGAGPLHSHTADYHLVVIEGTMKHWAAGESESEATALERGSYWFQPGGLPHADACLSEKCLMQVVWSGRRDGKLAEEPSR